MRIVVGAGPRVAGRRSFERFGSLLESVGSGWRPANAVVEVNLVGERRMAHLNRTYKGRRGAAEILTFPYPAERGQRAAERPVGEICLCWTRLRRGAAAAGVSERSYVLRLFVHGVVHLRGYRHDTAAAEARMEAVEKRILAARLSGRELKRLFL